MDLLACAGISCALALALAQARLGDVDGELRHLAGWEALALGLVIPYLSLKAYRIFLYPRYFSPLRHLPGPGDSHWLLGQFPNQARADTPAAMPVRWAAGEHPGAPLVRYLGLGNREVLIPNSTGVLRQLLQSHAYSFGKPGFFKRLITRFGGEGLATLEGDEHRAHRRMLNACFAPPVLQRLNAAFSDKAAQLGLLLGRAIEAGGGRGCVVDCADVFGRATLDIIGAAVFGADLCYMEHARYDRNGGPVRGDQPYGFHEAHDAILGAGHGFGTILMLLDGYFPSRWIPCGTNTEFNRGMAYIRAETKRLIADRRRQLAAAGGGIGAEEMSRDTLSFLLGASMPGGPAEGLGEDHMVGHLLNLMAGGHETSAHTLAFGVHVLATRQDIQDRLRADVSGLAARNPQPTFGEIDALPYLNNFVLETLRVYPAVALSAREASRGLQLGGVSIPRGTVLELVPAVTHMNPLVWGEDAAEFDPARWDTIGGADDPRSSPFAFMAFGNGPRVCIGKRFALNQIKVVLFETVRRFRFLAVGDALPPFTVENPGIVLRPRGMKVRVEEV